MSRTIVVTAATGNQGHGTIRALLASDQPWKVRAMTRDVNSSQAKALADEFSSDIGSGRLTLAQADLYDQASLRSAFDGAHGVYAVTLLVKDGKPIMVEEELKHEIEAGRNMVMAAKEAGVAHFVFSTLPDVKKASNGRFTRVYHFDYKQVIEKFAKEQLPGVTSVMPGYFYTNFYWPHYSSRDADGQVRFLTATPSDQVAQWTDPKHDIGIAVAKVFELGVDKTAGRTYLIMGPRVTPKQMAETFTKVTGIPSVHDPITPEEFGVQGGGPVGPGFVLDSQEMMEWSSIAPADKVGYGTMDPSECNTMEDLGLSPSSFEDWIRRTGWKGN
ncbi:hypothetical protein S7711_10009 [Stachybotrys chartarum IBT 7711]|uniref:NmrA-like domain-containing protein n=1 Tax=Stachybotrys chartarum (strain CBS 109288 / IBT 7711) TaxID=1280523 RepID=A0A084ALT7_STACB|nr:hypothetical protein S7711_10009 [Stachybotrys chartarum IBT 7711]KFA46984.1 hypothetical protein S40293_10051 [Stachybotrys chartarum IBT 40293]